VSQTIDLPLQITIGKLRAEIDCQVTYWPVTVECAGIDITDLVMGNFELRIAVAGAIADAEESYGERMRERSNPLEIGE